jgi:hypothetical protein
VNGRSSGYNGDRSEFERIVDRLHDVDQPRRDVDRPGAAAPRRIAVVPTARPRLHNGAFAAISLVIIIPMSIVTGGWLGLIAVIVSTVVAGLLMVEPYR